MKENIQNIIFDLGGVLLNIDYQETIQAFRNLDIPDFENVFTQFHQNNKAQNFEKGLITDIEFRRYISQLSSRELIDAEIDQAWNAMLLDFPIARYELLLNLKRNYKLFLLSNTNIIHYRAFQKIVRDSLKINSLCELFNHAYYSHEIKMRKPDAEIFEYILSEKNLNPRETLFIDDSIQHIQTAKSLNLNTIHLIAGQDVCSSVSELL